MKVRLVKLWLSVFLGFLALTLCASYTGFPSLAPALVEALSKSGKSYKDIEFLSLSGRYARSPKFDTLENIGFLSNLKKVQISTNGKGSLAALAELKKLHTLDIYRIPVEMLDSLPVLQEVCVLTVRVEYELSLAFLEKFPNLARLEIIAPSVSDEESLADLRLWYLKVNIQGAMDLTPVFESRTLKSVDLHLSTWSLVGDPAHSQITNLKVLCSTIPEWGFPTHLPYNCVLDIYCRNIGSKGLEALKNLSSNVDLRLRTGASSKTDVLNVPALETITIDKMKDDFELDISMLQCQLLSLTIYCRNLKISDSQYVFNCPTLQTLHIECESIEGIDISQAFPNVSFLKVESDTGFSLDPTGMQFLRYLRLKGISNLDVKQLRDNSELNSLYVQGDMSNTEYIASFPNLACVEYMPATRRVQWEHFAHSSSILGLEVKGQVEWMCEEDGFPANESIINLRIEGANDINSKAITGCRGLKTLRLLCGERQSRGINWCEIASLPQLERLEIAGEIDWEGSFPQIGTLESLEIENATEINSRALAKCSQLKFATLSCKEGQTMKLNWADITRIQTLECLEIRGEIGWEGEFAVCSSLYELWIEGSSKVSANILKAYPQIDMLKINDCRIIHKPEVPLEVRAYEILLSGGACELVDCMASTPNLKHIDLDSPTMLPVNGLFRLYNASKGKPDYISIDSPPKTMDLKPIYSLIKDRYIRVHDTNYSFTDPE